MLLVFLIIVAAAVLMRRYVEYLRTATYCERSIEGSIRRARALIPALRAVSPRRESWNTDCYVAVRQAEDALRALERTLAAVRGYHFPTHLDDVLAAAQRGDDREGELLARIRHLERVLQRGQTAYAQPKQTENPGLAKKMHRAVVNAIHPDRATDAAEREWRTKVCQSLFPQIDHIMDEVANP